MRRNNSLGQTTFENVIDFFAPSEDEKVFGIVKHEITTGSIITIGVVVAGLIILNKQL